MKMWKKLRRRKVKRTKVPHEVHSLPKSNISSMANARRRRKHDETKEREDIVVPALLSFYTKKQGRSVSKENVFPSRPSWESIENGNGKPPRSSNDNKGYHGMMIAESREDSSFAGSSIVSREVSLLDREAPPEAAPVKLSSSPEAGRQKVMAHNRSYFAKSRRRIANENTPARSKFALRPKSIVRKWNHYADMEEQGLAASPRHCTKLAKSRLHMELLAATSSLDSNDEDESSLAPSVTKVEKGGTLPFIPKSGTNREVQNDNEEYNFAETKVGRLMNPAGNGTLPFVQELSCIDREVQGVDANEAPTEIPVNYNPALPVEPFDQQDDGFQHITETGFPATRLDDNDNDPMQERSDDDLATKLTICTTMESDSPSLSSISDNGTTDESSLSLSFQSLPTTDTKHQCARQHEIVNLSLAQILVQSYQPDPNNPGYWKKKEEGDETKTNDVSTQKSFLRKDTPLPNLNTFLAEVKARRNEIMVKTNQEEQTAPMVEDWYGVKRQSKHASRPKLPCPNVGGQHQTNHQGSPKNLFAELQAKHREIGGRPVHKTKQKRIVVACEPPPPSSGSANTLLSELKAKQQEIKYRSVHPTKETAIVNANRGTGFLPDLMTELKAKQQEIKCRPTSSPAKGVNPTVAGKRKAGSTPGLMSELKAKQRAIEDRFYSRLANFQSSWRNEAVVIPGKS